MDDFSRRRTPEVLNRLQRLELRLYQLLGVRPFRSALFAIERWRRRKDGGKNQNYHLDRLSAEGAAAFQGYLLYHVLLHTASLLLTVPVAVWRRRRGSDWGGVDWLLTLLTVFNLWCIMLQRYNALRLRQLLLRRQAVRTRRVERHAARLVDVLLRVSGGSWKPELALVRRLLDGLRQGKDVFLNGPDASGLTRLAELLDLAGLTPRTRPAAESETLRSPDALASRARPWSGLEARVDRLQRLLRPRKGSLLARCAFVTEDAGTETAYLRLFGASGPAAVVETLLLLERVLEQQTAEEVTP